MTDSGWLSTHLLHADDGIESLSDVSPAIHLSTTYEYTSNNEVRDAVYSRCGIPTVERCEAVLGKILGAPCVTYSSGLSAIFALLSLLNPGRMYVERAEKGGYHGTLGVAETVQRLNKMELLHLSELDESNPKLAKGDVIWLETPLNPTGTATDIAKYSELASKNGALLCVDATFAPPPLQDPFKHGADWIMHSATKYFGGHSDLLAGVVASKDHASISKLIKDRENLGTVMSGQTAWLLLRSLRTFQMRIERQAKSALELVARLTKLISESSTSVLRKVTHSSLQHDPYIAAQMTGGHSPTFAIFFRTEQQAASFPHHLKLFHHATSLGGVESLVEWRTMSDSKCDRTLVRISVGIEDPNDLYADITNGLAQVS